MRNKLFHIIIFFFLILSCIDPFEPDYSGIVNENRLVVDANFAVGDDQHEVYLNRTYTVGTNGGTTRVSGATIYMEDSVGNKYFLEELFNGTYAIDDSEVCLEVGKQFQLFIELQNGEVFFSTIQTVPEIVKFDTIQYRIVNKPVLRDERIISVEFIEFIGVNNAFKEKSLFYQTDYGGVFGYTAPYQGSQICWPACAQETPPSNLSRFPSVCYITEQQLEPLNVGELKRVDKQLILLSIPTDFRFKIEYSVNLKVSSILKPNYEFIQENNDQIDYGGGLFDPPPTNIIGNIQSFDEGQSYALGYFNIKNSYEQRVYVDAISGIEDGQCNYTPLPAPECTQPPYDYCCDCLLYPGSQADRPSYFP